MGFKGVEDFLRYGVLPIVMLYLIINMFIAGKAGNFKKLMALVGTFLVPAILLGFVIAPDRMTALVSAFVTMVTPS